MKSIQKVMPPQKYLAQRGVTLKQNLFQVIWSFTMLWNMAW